jgi:hypothetical protein
LNSGGTEAVRQGAFTISTKFEYQTATRTELTTVLSSCTFTHPTCTNMPPRRQALQLYLPRNKWWYANNAPTAWDEASCMHICLPGLREWGADNDELMGPLEPRALTQHLLHILLPKVSDVCVLGGGWADGWSEMACMRALTPRARAAHACMPCSCWTSLCWMPRQYHKESWESA